MTLNHESEGGFSEGAVLRALIFGQRHRMWALREETEERSAKRGANFMAKKAKKLPLQ